MMLFRKAFNERVRRLYVYALRDPWRGKNISGVKKVGIMISMRQSVRRLPVSLSESHMETAWNSASRVPSERMSCSGGNSKSAKQIEQAWMMMKMMYTECGTPVVAASMQDQLCRCPF